MGCWWLARWDSTLWCRSLCCEPAGHAHTCPASYSRSRERNRNNVSKCRFYSPHSVSSCEAGRVAWSAAGQSARHAPERGATCESAPVRKATGKGRSLHRALHGSIGVNRTTATPSWSWGQRQREGWEQNRRQRSRERQVLLSTCGCLG